MTYEEIFDKKKFDCTQRKRVYWRISLGNKEEISIKKGINLIKLSIVQKKEKWFNKKKKIKRFIQKEKRNTPY